MKKRTEDELTVLHFPGMLQALKDAATMLEMLDKGEGVHAWRPGLEMFAAWLTKKCKEAEPLWMAAHPPDTPENPQGGSSE
jgi:hypothetical protein